MAVDRARLEKWIADHLSKGPGATSDLSSLEEILASAGPGDIEYLRGILSKLPPGSDEADRIQTLIEALENKVRSGQKIQGGSWVWIPPGLASGMTTKRTPGRWEYQ